MSNSQNVLNRKAFSSGFMGLIVTGGLLLSVVAYAETMEEKLKAQVQQEKQEKQEQDAAAEKRKADAIAAKKEKDRKVANEKAAQAEADRVAAAQQKCDKKGGDWKKGKCVMPPPPKKPEPEQKPEPVAPAMVESPVVEPVGASPAGDSSVVKPKMISIPAGTFTMGCDESRDVVDGMDGKCYDSEKPAHPVTINAFQMAETETTFDQWDACEKADACPHAEDHGWGRGNRPVISVSWDDITQKYIPWLNKETGNSYRLPTEAEWEYAARGGTEGAYPWGNSIGKGNANCYKDHCGDKFEYTAPVGSFAANGYGLHDMNGNVCEWCQDWYASDYYASSPASNPKGAASGAIRVLRGGAWLLNAQNVRSANRGNDAPDDRNGSIGFRLVLP